MKAALITFLALIASLALAIFEREAAVGGTRFAGSLAARAAFRSHGGPGGFQGGDNPFQSKGYNQFQGDRNPGSGNPAAPAPTAAAPAAPTFCKLDPSVLGSELNGNPAMPADLDGVCIASNACTAAGGQAINSGCSAGASCCIKFDCAGPNSNSACVQPNLQGDALPAGKTGGFVGGQCPPGLQCFQQN